MPPQVSAQAIVPPLMARLNFTRHIMVETTTKPIFGSGDYHIPIPFGPTRHDRFKVLISPDNWRQSAQKEFNSATWSGYGYFWGINDPFNSLLGVIRVFRLRSKEKPGVGFPTAAFYAENSHHHFTYKEPRVPYDHQAGWFIDNYFSAAWSAWEDPKSGVSSLDRDAAKNMAAQHIRCPQDFVRVRFMRAEKWGLQETDYLFRPDIEGISANPASTFNGSDWHPNNIHQYPEKMAYVEKLKEWATSFWSEYDKHFSDSK